MIYTFNLLFKARSELYNGWKWYEEKQVDLGERFEEEVFQKTDIIKINPEGYPQRTVFAKPP